MDPSPDGQWILLELVIEDYGMGDGDSALYVIDADGGGHWIASGSGYSGVQRNLWLPDGRLLWVDDGGLFTADGSGGDLRDLQAPETVDEIWLGASNTALVSGGSGMWRVNVDSGGWDRIDGAPRVGNLSVSLDGTYAVGVTFDKVELMQYWRLPLVNGDPATLLVEALFSGGHGGRIRPPLPILNSSLWFSGEWIYFEVDDITDMGVIDALDGTLTPLRELTEIPDIFTNQYEISPDKRWMLLGGEYVTSGEVLNEGLFLNGWVLGWASDPAGLYLLVDHPEGASWEEITSRSVEHVALPGGERTVLFEGLDPSQLPEIVADDVIYSLASDEAGSVVYAFSMHGEILATVDLPNLQYTPFLAMSGSALVLELPVNLGDAAADIFCLSEYLWIWDMKP
jgi:hypothetical protein